MSYEDLIREYLHNAMLNMVREHLGSGLTGVSLAKDGGLLLIDGKPGYAIHFAATQETTE